MKKKVLTLALSALVLALNLPVEAQQAAKAHRIGYIATGYRTSGTDSFLEGLRDLGYSEGRNFVIEYRFAEGKENRLAELATELVRLNVDVIVAASTAGAIAVQKVAKTVPVVLTDSADPVGAGLVASLARPGGNVTGLTFQLRQLTGKRFEVLKEIFPRIKDVAFLDVEADLHSAPDDGRDLDLEAMARALAVRLRFFRVRDLSNVENAFAAMVRTRADALLLSQHPFFTVNRMRVVELAAKSRLPTMYPHRNYVEAGGLMSYGANHGDLFRRAAYFVDKILKGAKPADLPVEQPTKFQLTVNLKTAKEIGVTIPSDVLMWAETVIR